VVAAAVPVAEMSEMDAVKQRMRMLADRQRAKVGGGEKVANR
jgi:hypothetical protein